MALANFADLMIDYPNSKDYAFGVFDKLKDLGIFTDEQFAKYRQHVKNLEDMDYEFE